MIVDLVGCDGRIKPYSVPSDPTYQGVPKLEGIGSHDEKGEVQALSHLLLTKG